MSNEFAQALAATRAIRTKHPKASLQDSPENLLKYYEDLISAVDGSYLDLRQACLLIGATYWYGCARHNSDIESIALEAGKILNIDKNYAVDIFESWNFLKLWINQLSSIYK